MAINCTWKAEFIMLRKAESSGKIHSLDGMRAVSIIIVFFSHAGYGKIIPGTFGVNVFFFISGLLITTLLRREFDKDGAISLKKFYIRRSLRIIPPLLFVIIFSAIFCDYSIVPGVVDAKTIFSQVLFSANYWQMYGDYRGIEGLEVLWSLAVEEHFYMFWPMLFLFFVNNRQSAKVWLAGSVMFFMTWRAIMFYGFGADEVTILHSSDTRFDSILIGCFASFLFPHFDRSIERYTTPRIIVFCAVAALMLLASFLFRSEEFRSIYRYSLQSLALIPIFYFATRFPDMVFFRWLNTRFIMFLGTISYSFYLVHDVIIAAFTNILSKQLGHIPLMTLAFAASVALAALIKLLIEDPTMKIRKRYH